MRGNRVGVLAGKRLPSRYHVLHTWQHVRDLLCTRVRVPRGARWHLILHVDQRQALGIKDNKGLTARERPWPVGHG